MSIPREAEVRRAIERVVFVVGATLHTQLMVNGGQRDALEPLIIVSEVEEYIRIKLLMLNGLE